MKLVQCDACGKQVVAEDIFGNPAPNWFRLITGGQLRPDEYLCSVDCLIVRVAALSEAVHLETIAADEPANPF